MGFIELHAKLKEVKFFYYVYLIGIVGSIVGLLFSRAVLSISQIVLACNWLLEGGFSIKIERLKVNWPALLFAGLYVLHALWLLNTTDYQYAWKDLRVKLPLLLYPIVFASIDKFDFKIVRQLLFFFIATIFSGTVLIAVNYVLKKDQLEDIREATFLISHIRLSLMICLSAAISIYYMTKSELKIRVILLINLLWLIVFMSWFVYITGIVILTFLLLFMIYWFVKSGRVKKPLQRTVYVILLLFLSSMGIYLGTVTYQYVKLNSHDNSEDKMFTANGHNYWQPYKEQKQFSKENGFLVYQNICTEELTSEWNKISVKKIDFTSNRFDENEAILLRYMSSKGLTKDSLGVANLSQNDIKAIESGVTNFHYQDKTRLYKRIHSLLWEYDNYQAGGDFNGHSLAIRLEFWKTGLRVFKRHFWFGTGTGDIEREFQVQYELDNSRLNQEWRFRTHNQLISFGASLGIFGLIYFILTLVIPIRMKRDYFIYSSFWLIFFLSIWAEDTLETQIGVSFYALFNSFLFFQDIKADKNSNDQ